MNTIILSFCLLFREYFLSQALVLWRKALTVIDFSGCGERSGRWRPFGLSEFERLGRRITKICESKSIPPHWSRQWVQQRSTQHQLQIQRSLPPIVPQYLDASDCLHPHGHHEPRLCWLLLHPVLPVHLRQGIEVRRDESSLGHADAFTRVRVRVDVERHKVDQRFVQQRARRLRLKQFYIRIFCGILSIFFTKLLWGSESAIPLHILQLST